MRCVTAAFIPLLIASGCARETRDPEATAPRRGDVLLVVLDAVRADALEPYGSRRPTSPFLRGLAAQSWVFDRAYVSSTWTASSVASLFTSLYVNQHGVLTGYRTTREALERGASVRLNRIPSGVETLPEVLKRLGYRTFGVADNLNIGEPMGFARGFDRFSANNRAGSDVVNDVVRQWADEIRSSRPYFLYVHYMDAHRPYRPRAPWYDPETPPTEQSRAAYESNVRAVDRMAEELFQLLGVDESTLAIVTADHGEEFLEHGGVGHQNTLYEELLRVPLIVSYAPLGTGRVPDVVSNLDLLPTLREFAGARPSSSDQGVSLFAVLRGEVAQPRAIFPMRWTEIGDAPIVRKGVVHGSFKYILSEPGRIEELYEVTTDPREKTNLAAHRPDVVAELRARLERFERSAAVHPREFTEPVHISSAAAERLRALGYVQ